MLERLLEIAIVMVREGSCGFIGLISVFINRADKSEDIDDIALVLWSDSKLLQGFGADAFWKRFPELIDSSGDSPGARRVRMSVG